MDITSEFTNEIGVQKYSVSINKISTSRFNTRGITNDTGILPTT